MYKRMTALILSLVLMAGVTGQALAADETGNGLTVCVDGVELTNAHATLIGGNTCVSFTALVQVLRPDAAITWENGQAVARANGLFLAARPGSLYVEANGRYLYVPGKIQSGGGEVLVPIRVLAKALSASVSWDGSVQVSSQGTPLVSGDQYYDATAVSLLSHLIYCESGNQSMEGKIAVGNVIQNRVASPSFPNTIYDVIYQTNQFSTAKSMMSRTPNADSVIAAKLCLEGATVLSNAYYFNNVSQSCWASRNKACIAVIGGHAFYG